jgi:deoxycytidine triphosphate deaminase
MGVLDLSVRMTDDWESYHKHSSSSDSVVYISPAPQLNDGPASVDLTVGDRCYKQNQDRYFLIGNGITLGAYQSLLVETAEKVATPYNVFGIVTGKGAQIFRGTFISTGKINPGFNNKLKIGIYNGSGNPLVIRKGEPLCSCLFLEMESSISAPLRN